MWIDWWIETLFEVKPDHGFRWNTFLKTHHNCPKFYIKYPSSRCDKIKIQTFGGLLMTRMLTAVTGDLRLWVIKAVISRCWLYWHNRHERSLKRLIFKQDAPLNCRFLHLLIGALLFLNKPTVSWRTWPLGHTHIQILAKRLSGDFPLQTPTSSLIATAPYRPILPHHFPVYWLCILIITKPYRKASLRFSAALGITLKGEPRRLF